MLDHHAEKHPGKKLKDELPAMVSTDIEKHQEYWQVIGECIKLSKAFPAENAIKPYVRRHQ